MTYKKENGFSLIIGVLIIGAVATTAVTSMLVIGVGSLKTSVATSDSSQARSYADACAEEAMQKLVNDLGYAGNESITFWNGTCSINALSGSGNLNRTIQTVGESGDSSRRVEVNIASVQPIITLTSWLEVAEF